LLCNHVYNIAGSVKGELDCHALRYTFDNFNIAITENNGQGCRLTDKGFPCQTRRAAKGITHYLALFGKTRRAAKRVRECLERVGLKTLSIEPGSPWENGYVESYNGKLR
jgi:hypothetical protein